MARELRYQSMTNRLSSRDTQRTDSLVPTAGRFLRPARRRTLTLRLPAHPCRTMDGSASVERFIVLRSDVRMSAPRVHDSPTSTVMRRWMGRSERTLCEFGEPRFRCRSERPIVRICLPARPLMPGASVIVRHSGGSGNGVSSRHAPVKPDEADLARAVATVSSIHA